MKKTLLAAALVAAFAAPAMAQEASPLTGNIGFTTDYIFRGISQTNHKPAIQGGVDYVHSSGLYVGAWGSNVSWLSDANPDVSSAFEVDVYGGYRGTFGKSDFTYDVGLVTYNYPGTYPEGFTKGDTQEVYGSIGWKWLSVKYSYATSNHIFGWVGANGEKTRGSDYIEANANYDLGNGWGVQGHVGHQKIKNLSVASYTDYKVGVTKDVGFGVVGFSYSDTNADEGAYTNTKGSNIADGRAMLSFTKTF